MLPNLEPQLQGISYLARFQPTIYWSLDHHNHKTMATCLTISTFRFDWRLIFLNLKADESHKNIIGPDEREKIWIPNLIFENSLEDVQILNDPFSSLIVYDTGNFTNHLNNDLQENKQYVGSENGITYSRVYKMRLFCFFEQHNYPFDSQKCLIKVNKCRHLY